MLRVIIRTSTIKIALCAFILEIAFGFQAIAAQPEQGILSSSSQHKKSLLSEEQNKTQSARYNWNNSKTSNSVGASKSKKKTTQSVKGRSTKKSTVGKLRSKSPVYQVKGKNKRYVIQRVIDVPLPSPYDPSKREFIKEVASPTDEHLEPAYLKQSSPTEIIMPRMPDFRTSYRGRVAGITEKREFIQYSINPELQEYAKEVVSHVTAPHVAIVAMEPQTGRILAIADKSISLKSAAMHEGFPAASLFKVITSAAAIERGSMQPDTEIAFRGGTYELSELNYDFNPVTDRRVMSVSEALGRSCNPVFSRVALQFLNPALLRYQAASFGFNSDLRLQVPVPMSRASIPNDDFNFGRTAAGFGDVYLSPIHAVTIMSAVANHGKMPRPSLVDQIISPTGNVTYLSKPSILRQAITPETAQILLHMMTYTTTVGTSKKEFDGKVSYSVPAKTGTLKGDDPKGLNHWFIAAAPYENPKIAVAVIVVNPVGSSSKANHIGRLLLEKYLR